MSYINIEIKARTSRADDIRKYLTENNADYRGTDYQTDTYYNTSQGRLKLRRGNIETNLIYYERNDQPGPKQSNFQLVTVTDGDQLNRVLTGALGVKVTVAKKREIYYIGNVKFHIDELEGMGHFVEIEAGNKLAPSITIEQLHEQCNHYMKAFDIREDDLVYNSYSDMLLK